jgi:hypothetical protein
MNVLSEEIIEATWVRLSELTIEELDELVGQLSEQQPDLFEYLTSNPEDFTENDSSFTLFMGLLIWLTLGQGGSELPIVAWERIEEQEENNYKIMAEMAELMIESEVEAIAKISTFYTDHHQEMLFGYIAAILSPDEEEDMMDEEDGMAISDSSRGPIFLMLKTTLDCLDS